MGVGVGVGVGVLLVRCFLVCAVGEFNWQGRREVKEKSSKSHKVQLVSLATRACASLAPLLAALGFGLVSFSLCSLCG